MPKASVDLQSLLPSLSLSLSTPLVLSSPLSFSFSFSLSLLLFLFCSLLIYYSSADPPEEEARGRLIAWPFPATCNQSLHIPHSLRNPSKCNVMLLHGSRILSFLLLITRYFYSAFTVCMIMLLIYIS